MNLDVIKTSYNFSIYLSNWCHPLLEFWYSDSNFWLQDKATLPRCKCEVRRDEWECSKHRRDVVLRMHCVRMWHTHTRAVEISKEGVGREKNAKDEIISFLSGRAIRWARRASRTQSVPVQRPIWRAVLFLIFVLSERQKRRKSTRGTIVLRFFTSPYTKFLFFFLKP